MSSKLLDVAGGMRVATSGLGCGNLNSWNSLRTGDSSGSTKSVFFSANSSGPGSAGKELMRLAGFKELLTTKTNSLVFELSISD